MSKLCFVMILAFALLFTACESPEVREESEEQSVPSEQTEKKSEAPKPVQPAPQPIKKEEPAPLTNVVVPEKTLEKVALCLCWQTQCQFAGFYAALENGFYKDEGLDVTLKPGGPDVRPFQEVADGNVQFGTGQAQEVLLARDKGMAIQCVATNFQIGALRLVANKSLGITGPEDLRGKKISLWFGGYEYQCLGLLERSGISKEEVTLEKQGWTMDDFCAGKVDVASVMVYNELNTLYEKGVKDIDILNYADYGINFPEDTIFALEKYIQQRPDVVEKIVRASYRGWKWAMENPHETVKIVMKHNDKLNVEHETSMLREVFKLMVNQNTKENGLGYIYTPDWINMSKILFQQKLLKEMPDISKAVNPFFVEKVKILPPATLPTF